MQRIEFRAMGCHVTAVLDSPSRRAGDLLAAVPEWFAEWEQKFSRFRDDSELAKLNHGAGAFASVSPAFWEVAQDAVRAANQTSGLVTPTLLNELEAAGYDKSFEYLQLAGQAATAPVSVTPMALANDWHTIQFDPRRRAICLPAGLRLDFGGVAKGWAADQAVKRLALAGPALVDAGGDIAAKRPPRGGRGWPIGVADPLHTGEQIGVLIVARGGVATSGRDYRKWQKGGAMQHHILDPRTGLPAQTDVLSATVVAPTAREAEAAAKAALILGSREGLGWLEARPTLAGLLVLESGTILRSRRMKNYLWS